MPRNPEALTVPRPGLEIVPFAALTRIPFPACAAAYPRLRLLGEATLGPLVICAAYQTLLTALRTEASVRRGELKRHRQLKLVLCSILPETRDREASTFSIGLTLSLLRLLVPSLTLPFALWGFLGIGHVSAKLINSFWDGMNDREREELKRRVFAAGANLRYRLDGWDVTLEA